MQRDAVACDGSSPMGDGEVQLRKCSGHIRVTRTCDYPLQSHNLRFASVMRARVSSISLM